MRSDDCRVCVGWTLLPAHAVRCREYGVIPGVISANNKTKTLSARCLHTLQYAATETYFSFIHCCNDLVGSQPQFWILEDILKRKSVASSENVHSLKDGPEQTAMSDPSAVYVLLQSQIANLTAGKSVCAI